MDLAPNCRELVEWQVCPSASRQLTYRTDTLLGDVAKAYTIPINVTSVDLAGDATVGVASSAELAGNVTVGVVSSAVAEVASSAVADVASSADFAEVASSVDLAVGGVLSRPCHRCYRWCAIFGRPC